MNKVYISIGSNLGDRAAYCAKAVTALKQVPAFHIRRCSSVYVTEPVGFVSENWFYNLVVELDTACSPWEVFLILLKIEFQNGRKKKGVLSDRTLDLDLLLYEDFVLTTRVLSIPHPALDKRRFVLAPLTELNPLGKHPVIKKSFAELLVCLPDQSKVKKLGLLPRQSDKRVEFVI